MAIRCELQPSLLLVPRRAVPATESKVRVSKCIARQGWLAAVSKLAVLRSVSEPVQAVRGLRTLRAMPATRLCAAHIIRRWYDLAGRFPGCFGMRKWRRGMQRCARITGIMHPAGWLSFIAMTTCLMGSTVLASPPVSSASAVPSGSSTASTSSGHEADAPIRHRVNVGIGPLLYIPPTGPVELGWAVEASYGVRHRRHDVEADVGFRSIVGDRVSGTVAFDAFAGIALAPTLGRIWEPRIGLELGISSAANAPIDRDRAAPESFYRAFSDASSGYVGTVLAPARFRWQRWRLEALGIFMGSAIPGFGRTARLQVNFLRLGAAF
jgi:hypothetical protein